MGFLGDVFSGRPFGSDENSGGWLTDVFDPLDFTGKKSKNAAAGQAAKQAAAQAKWKQTQYDLLGQKKAPTLTPQQEARIKALENESKLTLEQDPNFQSQLRQARVGGAQSLASIQNNQAATGATGGFQNVGSAADVYDRLGVQLADLAGQQQQAREQKRDVAADARQAAADAQTAYDNAVVDAKIAIEAGDAQATQDAMNRLYAAQEQINARMRDSAIGLGSMVLGAFTGNPMAVSGGAKGIQAASQGQGPTAVNLSQQESSLPRYAQSNFFGSQMQNKPYYTFGR